MIYFIICLVLFEYSEAACATTIWEGQSHNLTCAQQDGNVKSIAWSVILPQGPKSLIVCQASSCTCIGLTFNFCQHISSDGCSNYNCTIQFKNVTRDMQYTWICTASGVQINTYCDFQTILAYPKPALDDSCPNGLNVKDKYILKGTNASCTCKLEIPGIPNGHLQWFNTLIGVAADQEYRDNGTNLFIEYKDKGNSFICQGISPVNNISNERFDIIFTPKFAFGPESVNLRVFNSSNQLKICANETILIQVSCEVAITDINPSPQFSVYLKNNVMPEYTQGFVNVSAYTFQKNLLVNKSGDNQIICSVRNSIFSQLQLVHNLVVTVNGPPTDSPVLTVGRIMYSHNNGMNVESQKEGSDINIICQVFGGFPDTYNMFLSCDDSYNNSATNSNNVSLTIEKVRRQLNGKQCICKVDHVTSCYVNNTSSVTLNISYPASIDHFTANYKNSTLIVSDNSYVIFICNAESNPSATVELSKTETIGANIGTVNYTKQVTCEDGGEYFCKAHNSEFLSPALRSLSLNVQCALQLRNPNDDNKVILGKLQRDIIISFEIFGYPTASSYTLFMLVNGSMAQMLSSYLLNTLVGKYKVDFAFFKLPYGTVYVTIYNIIQADFTNYTLSIYNGLGKELFYNFKVEQETITSKTSTSEVVLAAIGGVIAGIIVTAIVIFLFIKRKDLKHLKVSGCIRQKKKADSDDHEVPNQSSGSQVNAAAIRGYEEIDLVQNYDRLQQIPNLEQNTSYSQISIPTVYDPIDASQINIAYKYESVNIKEKGNYQNVDVSKT